MTIFGRNATWNFLCCNENRTGEAALFFPDLATLQEDAVNTGLNMLLSWDL